MADRGYTHPGTRRLSTYDPVLSPTYTTGLWADCPLQDFVYDHNIGFLIEEQWTNYNAAATTGTYTLTQATAGTGAISTTEPGALNLDSGSTTVTQGANLQRLKSAIIPATGKDIWAEFKIKSSFLTLQGFVGLKASNTTIIASSTLNGQNHIGWSTVTGDGVLLLVADKAGTALTPATATTLVASTYVRLGFRYDGTADTVQQYINGVATGAAVPTANIPKVALYPSFVCQTSGTSQPVMGISAYKIFQLR